MIWAYCEVCDLVGTEDEGPNAHPAEPHCFYCRCDDCVKARKAAKE